MHMMQAVPSLEEELHEDAGSPHTTYLQRYFTKPGKENAVTTSDLAG